MARIEFKPPSDFVDNDSGGGRSSVWKWLGIGCGVVVLIVGLLMAFGAWKTFSCCSDVADFARTSQQATEFSAAFAQDLADSNVEQARSKMTDSLADRMSAEELAAKIDEHSRFLTNAKPRVTNMSVDQDSADFSGPARWEITVEFSPAAAREKLAVILVVVTEGEEEQREFFVNRLEFAQRERNLRSEPPAEAVAELHRNLAAGNYEQAYERMNQKFTSQNDRQAFREYVRSQPPVFRSSDVRIQQIEYSSQREAFVVVEAAAEGQRARIEYQVHQAMPHQPVWQISAINPTYTDAGAEPPADEAGEGAEEAGADEAGADEAGADEAGADEAGAEGEAP